MQWALPSGGIGAAIAWIANRNVRRATNAKMVHDAYKTMYEDVSALLMKNQQKYEELNTTMCDLTSEHDRTRRALNRLSRAIEAIQICPHRDTCPVSSELSLDEDSVRHTGRQNANQDAERKGRQQRKTDGQRKGGANSRDNG